MYVHGQDELFLIEKDLLYTGDYNMKGNSPVPPVQGGFLVIRPSMERFHELRYSVLQILLLFPPSFCVVLCFIVFNILCYGLLPTAAIKCSSPSLNS